MKLDPNSRNRQYLYHGINFGYDEIPVLHFLYGLPWNDLSEAYVWALRPSEIWITNGTSSPDFTDNVCPWRVIITLTEDGTIVHISQEVEVRIPSGISNGYALRQALRNQRSHSLV